MKLWQITDRGKVRQKNQDVCLTLYDKKKKIAAIVVCDGMGGANAGNVASEMAAAVFMANLKNHLYETGNADEISALVKSAVNEANAAVYAKSLADVSCNGMGTTLVAAVATETNTVIMNVGDSRAYHAKDGAITQITKDHSVVEDLVSCGEITRSEAAHHPQKNLITRVVGTNATLHPDLFYPDIGEGEYLILCSDGLSNIVQDEEILAEILHSTEPEKICKDLLAIAMARGAPDNVTIAILQK